MAKSRAKGINAAWNEFYNSLPQEYKDHVMGGVAEYGESENLFKDAYNKFHPKGNRNKIGDYSDYADTPEKFADIFFFQDPDFGNPDDAEDLVNIAYKAHPEMRENFLRFIAGTPEEREQADEKADEKLFSELMDRFHEYPMTPGLQSLLSTDAGSWGEMEGLFKNARRNVRGKDQDEDYPVGPASDLGKIFFLQDPEFTGIDENMAETLKAYPTLYDDWNDAVFKGKLSPREIKKIANEDSNDTQHNILNGLRDLS